MAVKSLITMGHPTLREKAKLVDDSEFGTSKLNSLITDLIDTMHDSQGIGIAAPQINVSKQVCIIELPDDSPRYDTKNSSHKLFVVINPKIKILDGTLSKGIWEGCLSVPGLRGFVRRSRAIQVSYQDQTGAAQKIKFDDFLAIVFQHEIDHLKGKLFVDRVSDNKNIIFEEHTPS